MKNLILFVSLLFNTMFIGYYIHGTYFNIPLKMTTTIMARGHSSSAEGDRYYILVKELGQYERIRVNKFVYDHIIISKIRCLDEYNVETDDIFIKMSC